MKNNSIYITMMCYNKDLHILFSEMMDQISKCMLSLKLSKTDEVLKTTAGTG